MNNNKFIYISGPITGVKDFMNNFKRAQNKLEVLGYCVVNPATCMDPLPEETTHKQFMKVSIGLLSICDNIYMLDKWENSKGANQEYGYALGKGMNILFEKEPY